MAIPEFEPKATGFSLANARVLGQAAAVAYESAAACEAWARAQGLDEEFDFFSSSAVVEHSDTQGFVAQNKDIVLVAFRGTQPNQPVDWLSDFKASHETWGHPAGKVHKGFYEALRAVWGQAIGGREILPARLLSRGDRTVWITGHSLGGALAELCAAQAFFVRGVPVQGVYTFGQPRVGDDAFAQTVHGALGTRIFRFVNDRDIVPRVPLHGMGYAHYGCEIFFDHVGKRFDREPGVESLAGALRLGALALNIDPLQEAAKMFAAATIEAGFFGDPRKTLQRIVGEWEKSSLGNPKALLAAGTEKIADHDMRQQYLARLG